jgi:hypothetical protein
MQSVELETGLANLFNALLAEDVTAAEDDRVEENGVADGAVHLVDQSQEPLALRRVERHVLFRLCRQALKMDFAFDNKKIEKKIENTHRRIPKCVINQYC